MGLGAQVTTEIIHFDLNTSNWRAMAPPSVTADAWPTRSPDDEIGSLWLHSLHASVKLCLTLDQLIVFRHITGVKSRIIINECGAGFGWKTHLQITGNLTKEAKFSPPLGDGGNGFLPFVLFNYSFVCWPTHLRGTQIREDATYRDLLIPISAVARENYCFWMHRNDSCELQQVKAPPFILRLNFLLLLLLTRAWALFVYP